MRATLSFNLNDPDDIEAHMRCVKATEITLALWSIINHVRTSVDHSEDGKHIDGYALMDNVQESLEKYDINIDHLIS